MTNQRNSLEDSTLLERVGAAADHPEECVPVHSIDELSGNARASAITMAGPHL